MSAPKEPPFKSLRIAGKRYRVRWGKRLDGDCGKIQYTKLVISVGKEMGRDEERESLLHEVIHGIDYQHNTKLKEKQVRQLSIGLFETLKNNPKLVAYLLGNEDEE